MYYPQQRGTKRSYANITTTSRTPGGTTVTTTKRRRVPRRFVARTKGPFANTESKYFDTYVEAAAINSTAAMSGKEMDPATQGCLNCPVEGNDMNNRVGRRIEIYKVVIRGVLNNTGAGDLADPLGPGIFRYILYIDKQANGTQSQSEDLLSTVGAGPTIVNNVNAFQSIANLGRFRVLKDRILRPGVAIAFNDSATTGTQKCPDKYFKCSHKFKKPLITRFNATNGGTYADIVDNAIHFILYSNDDGQAWTCSYHARLYYKDA